MFRKCWTRMVGNTTYQIMLGRDSFRVQKFIPRCGYNAPSEGWMTLQVSGKTAAWIVKNGRPI